MDDRWITDWPTGRAVEPLHAGQRRRGAPDAGLAARSAVHVGPAASCPGGATATCARALYDLDEFDPDFPEAVGFFGGYMYINLSNVRMQGVRNPAVTVEQLDLAFFGDHPDVPPYEEHPLDERPDLVPKIVEHLGWVMSTTSWPEFDEEKRATIALRDARPDLASISRRRARRLRPQHPADAAEAVREPHRDVEQLGHRAGDPVRRRSGDRRPDDPDEARSPGSATSTRPSRATPCGSCPGRIRGSAELTAAFDDGVDGLLDRLRRRPDDAGRGGVPRRLRAVPRRLRLARPERVGDQRRDVGDAARDRAGRPRPRSACRPTTSRPRIRNQRKADERAAIDRRGAGQGGAARRRAGRPVRGRARRRPPAGLPRAHQDEHRARRARGADGVPRARPPPRRGRRPRRRRATCSCCSTTSSSRSSPTRRRSPRPLADRYAAWQELWGVVPPYFIKRRRGAADLDVAPARRVDRRRAAGRRRGAPGRPRLPGRSHRAGPGRHRPQRPRRPRPGRHPRRPAHRPGLDAAVHGRRWRRRRRRRPDQPRHHRQPRARPAVRRVGHRRHRADPRRCADRGRRRHRHASPCWRCRPERERRSGSGCRATRPRRPTTGASRPATGRGARLLVVPPRRPRDRTGPGAGRHQPPGAGRRRRSRRWPSPPRSPTRSASAAACSASTTTTRSILAKELATIDWFSGGRLEIGLGAGWLQGEYEAIGVPFDRAGRAHRPDGRDDRRPAGLLRRRRGRRHRRARPRRRLRGRAQAAVQRPAAADDRRRRAARARHRRRARPTSSASTSTTRRARSARPASAAARPTRPSGRSTGSATAPATASTTSRSRSAATSRSSPTTAPATLEKMAPMLGLDAEQLGRPPPRPHRLGRRDLRAARASDARRSASAT